MTKTIHFTPRGVCSRAIDIQVENDIIKSVKFTGGCAGNTQGVAALTIGRHVNEVIGLLSEITCGNKGTSCPAQLAEALTQAI